MLQRLETRPMPLNASTAQTLLPQAEALLPWLAALRGELARLAEPAFAEQQTAACLAGALETLGLAVRTGVGHTGLVADFDTGRPGPTVALRADMDALPREDGQGFAHTCGHDGNMVCVLGATRLLQDTARQCPAVGGRLRLLFQPAEEQASGAAAMLADDALEGVALEAIYTPHASPPLPVGRIACRPGPLQAGCDQFCISLRGRGGHGARPQDACNPLPGLAAVILAIEDLTLAGAVKSICTAEGGHRPNVIPEEARCRGSLRTYSAEQRATCLAALEAAAGHAAASRSLRATFTVEASCPPVVVQHSAYRRLERLSAAILGAGSLTELPAPSAGSEDFSLFLAHAPGLIVRIGVGADSPSLHHPCFRFRDEALPVGAALLAGLVLDHLCRDETLPNNT